MSINHLELQKCAFKLYLISLFTIKYSEGFSCGIIQYSHLENGWFKFKDYAGSFKKISPCFNTNVYCEIRILFIWCSMVRSDAYFENVRVFVKKCRTVNSQINTGTRLLVFVKHGKCN